jgi:hypothetical protein
VRQPLLATETADKFDILMLASMAAVFPVRPAPPVMESPARLCEFNVELRSRLKKLGF